MGPRAAAKIHEKGGEIYKLAIRPNRSSTLPANIEQTALSSWEDPYNLLKAKQHKRFRTQGFDGARDDAHFTLHPMRFVTSTHISLANIFQLGLTYHKETKLNSLWHDLMHLKGGNMIDN